jgi:GTPase SAR1 family protein
MRAIEACQQAATGYGRPDLAVRLAVKAERLADSSFHVLVVGEFKQGKSSLLNALVSTPICPVDDDIATAVPTIIRWSAEPTAVAVFREERDETVDIRRELISLEDVASYAVEQVGDDERSVHSVEIGLPSRLLSGGLVLVDTPGVGGLGSTHGAVTAAAIPMAEAVIFVSDASQEFTAPELEFMQATRKLCPNIVCLVTKTDFYPAWRKIRDLNVAHLKRLGIAAPIIATSASLHTQAMATGDANLLEESGYPELTTFIRNDVLGSAVELSVAAAASDLHDVLDQLTDQFLAQQAVLDDPAVAQAMITELEATKARADELKGRAARWQITLNDGVQDLNTDVDHDLRERFRKINVDAEQTLEDADPADIWGEFEPWLYHRTAFEVVQNYEFLQHRSKELTDRVAEHFEADSDGLRLDLRNIDPDTALSQVQARAALDVETAGSAATLMIGVRGGMGGMMMFGMLSSVVGLALGPIGIGAGVLMGRKQIRDEKKRQVLARRTQARNAQRKYMDDANFRASKDSRDTLRWVQREVRDYFSTRAEEQSRATQETLIAVQSATQMNEKDRARRLIDVNVELGRLAEHRTRVDALGPRLAGFGAEGGSL